jgi:hypothetical protein
MDRHAEARAALLNAVLETPGETDRATRHAAFIDTGVPPPLDTYVARVHGESYRVTDAEIDGLTRAGVSEDAVLETTLAAALGAASRRLEIALGAMGEAD